MGWLKQQKLSPDLETRRQRGRSLQDSSLKGCEGHLSPVTLPVFDALWLLLPWPNLPHTHRTFFLHECPPSFVRLSLTTGPGVHLAFI